MGLVRLLLRGKGDGESNATHLFGVVLSPFPSFVNLDGVHDRRFPGWGGAVQLFQLLVITIYHEGIHWLHFTVVILRVGCWTTSVAKILTESFLG